MKMQKEMLQNAEQNDSCLVKDLRETGKKKTGGKEAYARYKNQFQSVSGFADVNIKHFFSNKIVDTWVQLNTEQVNAGKKSKVCVNKG